MTVIDWQKLGWDLAIWLQCEGFKLTFETSSWFDFDLGGEG